MTLTFVWESLSRLLADGLEDMVFADWEEVEVDRDSVPLAIDWTYYQRLEQMGTYRVIAARSGRTLVGYNSFFLNRHTRARDTLWAVNDVLYLVPEERRGMAGAAFLRRSEAMLKEAGAAKVQYGIKDHLKIGVRRGTVGDLLTRLGYRYIEAVYAKVL